MNNTENNINHNKLIVISVINATTSIVIQTNITPNQMPKASISSVYIGLTLLHTQHDM